jgi:hypothetical protein
MKLVVAHVDGDDLGGTILENAIGESAGGGSGIEDPSTLDEVL